MHCIAIDAQGMTLGSIGLEEATDNHLNQRQAMMLTPPKRRGKNPAGSPQSPRSGGHRVPKRSAKLQRQDFWASDGAAPSEQVCDGRHPQSSVAP